jgi:hypothetical protein
MNNCVIVAVSFVSNPMPSPLWRSNDIDVCNDSYMLTFMCLIYISVVWEIYNWSWFWGVTRALNINIMILRLVCMSEKSEKNVHKYSSSLELCFLELVLQTVFFWLKWTADIIKHLASKISVDANYNIFKIQPDSEELIIQQLDATKIEVQM